MKKLNNTNKVNYGLLYEETIKDYMKQGMKKSKILNDFNQALQENKINFIHDEVYCYTINNTHVVFIYENDNIYIEEYINLLNN